jgi:hypothetical protein
MLLTPSMIGALLAGICLWSLFWAALHKIEEIPGVRDAISTNQCLEWIEQRPGLTLLLTGPPIIWFTGFRRQWELALPWEGPSSICSSFMATFRVGASWRFSLQSCGGAPDKNIVAVQ